MCESGVEVEQGENIAKCPGSEQGRPLSHTRPSVRWSLVCESGTGGKMLQSVLVHNSDTLKDMHCDVCAVY